MAEEREPWSVKGIDDRARQAAREAARERGLTLGEYLNALLTENAAAEPPRPSRRAEPIRAPRARYFDTSHDEEEDEMAAPVPERAPLAPAEALKALARRIEAIETRSTLAITGMDQSVIGLVRRLENAEHGQNAVVNHVDTLLDDVRDTYDQVQARIRQLEADDTAKRSLESLKSLEDALGRLAAHVHEEGALAQAETDAIRGRVEAGFTDLGDRVEAMEVRVERTLSDAAKRVEKAVEQAELRTEGSSRHLSERFSALEEKVAARMERVDQVSARMDGMQHDVSGALTSMEGLLTRIQDRLNRAEASTDAAMKALETTFDALDRRIDVVATQAGPAAAEKLREQFESRFEGLADVLHASIEKARAELAAEIERTARAVNPEHIVTLTGKVETLGLRLSEAEARQARALDTVGSEVQRLGQGFDRRLREVETRDTGVLADAAREEIARIASGIEDRLDAIDAREASAIGEVGRQVGDLADKLESRITDSEQRSAQAIEQVGEQVAGVVQRLKSRQEEAIRALNTRLDTDAKRQETRLSEALESMSKRLELVSAETRQSISPVQRAMASLVSRIEALEDFNPPAAAPLPAPGPSPAAPPAPAALASSTASAGDFEPGLAFIRAEMERHAAHWDKPTARAETASVPEPVKVAATEPDPAEDLDEWDMGERHELPPEPRFETARAGFERDPFDALGVLGGDEVRDSDIFAREPDAPPAPQPALAARAASDTPPPRLFDDQFLPGEGEDEPALPPASAAARDADADDYLARARRAALAASQMPAEARRPRAGMNAKAEKPANSRVPLLAAASALAVAAAGGAGYYYLRGRAAPPPVAAAPATPTPAPLDMGALTPEPAATLGADSAGDAVLFGEDPGAGDDALDETLFAGPESPPAATTPPAVPAKATAPAATTPPPAARALPPIATTETVATAPVEKPRPPAPVITLESAAREGNPVAQLRLGEARLAAGSIGEGVGLVEQSARAGLPAAQYRLAKLYERGTGLPRDITQSRTWTERAANGGNAKAMHDLAVFYAEGEGGAQSYASAATWFRRAAEFGVVDSQFNLGLLYEQGLGVSPDLGEALFWYEVAGLNGDAMAGERVRALRQRVSLDTAQAAQRRAATFIPAAADPAANGQFGPQPWETPATTAASSLADVQAMLVALGYNPGPVDGQFGQRTRDAISQFQRDRGLPVNGDVDGVLMIALRNALQPKG